MGIKKAFDFLISLIKPIVKPILITSNLIVFTTFIVTGFIVYNYVGNKNVGLILFFTAFLYILFNKIDSMDRRIKILEE